SKREHLATRNDPGRKVVRKRVFTDKPTATGWPPSAALTRRPILPKAEPLMHTSAALLLTILMPSAPTVSVQSQSPKWASTVSAPFTVTQGHVKGGCHACGARYYCPCDNLLCFKRGCTDGGAFADSSLRPGPASPAELAQG